MSINLLIKERLQLFRHLLGDIKNFKQNREQKEKEIQIPKNVNFTIQDLLDSENLYDYFVSLNAKTQEMMRNNKKAIEEKKQPMQIKTKRKKEILIQDTKLAINTSCFNQRTMAQVNEFYASPNEANLVNMEICYTIFEIIKNCLKHGIEIKKHNTNNTQQFVLSSLNKKKKFNSNATTLLSQKNRNLSTGNLFKPSPNFKIVERSGNNSNYTSTSNSKISYSKAVTLIHKKDYLPLINANAKQEWKIGNMTSTYKNRFRDTFSIDKSKKSYGKTTSELKVHFYSKKNVNNNNNTIKGVGNNYDYRDIFTYFNLIKQN